MYRKCTKCIHEKVVMYSFTVSGYVMVRLTKELEAQFEESEIIKQTIHVNLKKINYGN